MSKFPFTLQEGETIIDTWTLIYIPPGGGKYNGKLTVTNKRLLYDAIFSSTIGNRRRTQNDD